MPYRLRKLHFELEDAGIPIFGVGGDDPDQDGVVEVVKVDFKPEATAQQRAQADTIVAAHDPADTAAAALGSARDLAAQFQSDFITIKDRAITYYQSLSGSERSNILTVLNNWGTLNSTVLHMVNRTNALLGIVALLYIAVWWLYLKVKYIAGERF